MINNSNFEEIYSNLRKYDSELCGIKNPNNGLQSKLKSRDETTLVDKIVLSAQKYLHSNEFIYDAPESRLNSLVKIKKYVSHLIEKGNKKKNYITEQLENNGLLSVFNLAAQTEVQLLQQKENISSSNFKLKGILLYLEKEEIETQEDRRIHYDEMDEEYLSFDLENEECEIEIAQSKIEKFNIKIGIQRASKPSGSGNQ